MNHRHIRNQSAASRGSSGFILIGIMVIVMLASMVTLSLIFRVKAEQTATAASNSGDQAWAAAMSGIEEAMRIARQGTTDSTGWLNNPAAFQGRQVFDDGSEKWFFSVYSAGLEETDTQARYGLTDEASKIDVNLAEEEILEKIPKMTRSLAQGILDFIDPDSLARPEGAEQEYYDALPKSYLIHNHPLNTIDELLLVRGVTPDLLYGEDANWNFRLDPNEDDGEAIAPLDNKDGRLDLGWRQILTVSSYEPDNDESHLPRTNINNPSRAFPAVSLPASLTNYIAALRRNHIKVRHAVDLLEASGKFKDESGKLADYESGVTKEELPVLLDHFTATDNAMLRGLVNINTASARVLAALPGLDESLIDTIISTRRSLPTEKKKTTAWLYQEGVLDAVKFKEIAPRLTARSYQFSFRVVGYGVPSGRFRVLDVLVDLATEPGSIVRIRDISRLGLPFQIQVESDDLLPVPSKTQIGLSPATRHSHHG